jgi:hypothetical protein
MKHHQTIGLCLIQHLGLALLIVCTTPVLAEPAPLTVDFGAAVQQTAKSLEPLCTSQTLQSTEPPQIPGVSDQVQITCEGFDYFGASRTAEFIFGDDALTIIWILIDASETDDLEDSFKETFGEPSHDNANFTAFASHQAAVRKDVPEALYYAPAVSQAYREWFDQQNDSN